MSYDGLVTRAVTFEIKKLLLGAKIFILLERVTNYY